MKTSVWDLCVLGLQLSLTVSFCSGYQAVQGKYESMNQHRVADAKNFMNETPKMFFGNKYAPLSENGAKSCNCSK